MSSPKTQPSRDEEVTTKTSPPEDHQEPPVESSPPVMCHTHLLDVDPSQSLAESLVREECGSGRNSETCTTAIAAPDTTTTEQPEAPPPIINTLLIQPETSEVVGNDRTEKWKDCAPEANGLKYVQKGRRKRPGYEEWQQSILEQCFLLQPYPSKLEKEDLVRATQLPMDRIKHWYQNRRARERRMRCKQEPATGDPATAPLVPHKPSPSTPDTLQTTTAPSSAELRTSTSLIQSHAGHALSSALLIPSSHSCPEYKSADTKSFSLQMSGSSHPQVAVSQSLPPSISCLHSPLVSASSNTVPRRTWFPSYVLPPSCVSYYEGKPVYKDSYSGTPYWPYGYTSWQGSMYNYPNPMSSLTQYPPSSLLSSILQQDSYPYTREAWASYEQGMGSSYQYSTYPYGYPSTSYQPYTTTPEPTPPVPPPISSQALDMTLTSGMQSLPKFAEAFQFSHSRSLKETYSSSSLYPDTLSRHLSSSESMNLVYSGQQDGGHRALSHPTATMDESIVPYYPAKSTDEPHCATLTAVQPQTTEEGHSAGDTSLPSDNKCSMGDIGARHASPYPGEIGAMNASAHSGSSLHLSSPSTSVHAPAYLHQGAPYPGGSSHPGSPSANVRSIEFLHQSAPCPEGSSHPGSPSVCVHAPAFLHQGEEPRKSEYPWAPPAAVPPQEEVPAEYHTLQPPQQDHRGYKDSSLSFHSTLDDLVKPFHHTPTTAADPPSSHCGGPGLERSAGLDTPPPPASSPPPQFEDLSSSEDDPSVIP